MEGVVTRILLIRHASTDPHGRLCGSFDLPLSRRGREELQTLVRRPMARPAPDALFTSTLRRAQDVAAALARPWMLDRQPAGWAREIHCGDVEGMRLADVQRLYPELWARNESQSDDAFAWPGGETYNEFRTRIVEGLKATVEAHSAGRVAIVTHAGVISQVLGVILGRPAAVWKPDRPQPLTATEITWHNGGPSRVLSYNDPDWY
jgi:broad specificity phosphatase PhoE